jgi:tetratricopeptide (TPR) repeat protein
MNSHSPNDIDSTSIIFEEKARQANEDAKVFFDTKKYDKALVKYQEAIRLNPKLVNSYYNIALTYFRQKNMAQSEFYYLECIRVSNEQEDQELLFETCRDLVEYIYLENAKIAEMIDQSFAEKIIDARCDEDYEAESAYLAQRQLPREAKEKACLEALKYCDMAVDISSRRIKRKDDDPKANDAPKAYALRAKLYQFQKQYAKAISDVLNAIKLDAENTIYYFLLADIYIKNKTYSEAINPLNKIIDLNESEIHKNKQDDLNNSRLKSKSADAYRQLAWIYEDKTKHEPESSYHFALWNSFQAVRYCSSDKKNTNQFMKFLEAIDNLTLVTCITKLSSEQAFLLIREIRQKNTILHNRYEKKLSLTKFFTNQILNNHYKKVTETRRNVVAVARVFGEGRRYISKKSPAIFGTFFSNRDVVQKIITHIDRNLPEDFTAEAMDDFYGDNGQSKKSLEALNPEKKHHKRVTKILRNVVAVARVFGEGSRHFFKKSPIIFSNFFSNRDIVQKIITHIEPNLTADFTAKVMNDFYGNNGRSKESLGALQSKKKSQ